MQNHDRAYYRDVRMRAIHRKKRLANEIYGIDWYHKDGQYSKGKIHCGCPLCKFDKHYNLPTIKMRREYERYDSQIEEFETLKDNDVDWEVKDGQK